MCLKWGGNYIFFLSYRPTSSMFLWLIRKME